jgi:hypothetical protein
LNLRHPTRSLLAPSIAVAAALACTAATAATPVAEPSTHDQLEQEKQVYNVYKAWFPSLELARKAAISFHGQLLESDYAGGFLILQLEPADMDKLKSFGFRLEQATDFIARRNRILSQFQIAAASRAADVTAPTSIPGYSCYETVEETFAVGDAFIAAKPTLASWASAGSSWQKTQGSGGYDVKVLKLTNSAIAGDKPKLFINSAIHAREYTTAPLVLEFARWLVNGYGSNADATWIMNHHEVHLMLHTNPDGRKKAETGLSWRKNTNNNYCANSNNRGIDLNRNFSFTWNSTNGQGSSGTACDLTYRGPSAGSEPETQAVQAYIRNLWPDRRGPGQNDAAPSDTSGVHLDIHSYSQLVLWPWGETATPSPNATALQTMGRRLAYFNGYTPQQSIGLYPTDGTSDGPSYGELGVPSFTIELGSAFFESCTSYNNTTKPANLPALIYAAKVVRTPYITPGGPDVTTVTLAGDASGAGVVAGTAVALSASATDTRFNNSNGTEPTQAIAAAEYTIDTPPWDAAATPKPLSASDGSFNATTEALTGSIATFGLSNGQHLVYVRARDAGGTFGPVSAVFLNISAQPLAVTEIESNDTLTSAQTVASLPAVVRGGFEAPTRMSARADTDVYRVSLPAGRTLSATLTPGTATTAKLELLDASGVRLDYSAPAEGMASTAGWTNGSAGTVTVYVKASYVSGAFGSFPGQYTLNLGL